MRKPTISSTRYPSSRAGPKSAANPSQETAMSKTTSPGIPGHQKTFVSPPGADIDGLHCQEEQTDGNIQSDFRFRI